MDIRQLHYFSEVARNESFTRASEILHVSQPSLSKTIKLLEHELGVILLERSTKRLQLTDAGRTLYKQSLKILKDFTDLSSELADLLNLETGNIKIGLPPMVGASIFPQVLTGFYQKYPKISIQLIEVGAIAVTQQVENGSLDLGAIVLPLSTAHQFECIQLNEDNLMVVLSLEHSLANLSSISLKQLEHESFIMYRSDFALHFHIKEQCLRLGFEPKIIYESSQWDFMSQMAAANLGVALLPKTICKELNPQAVRCIPLISPVIPWNLGLVWRKDRYLSFATREFIRYTKSQISG